MPRQARLPAHLSADRSWLLPSSLPHASPRKEATVLHSLAMFISSTKAAWVSNPRSADFWARSSTSCWRIRQFSCAVQGVGSKFSLWVDPPPCQRSCRGGPPIPHTSLHRELNRSSIRFRVSGTWHFFIRGK